MRDVLYSPEMRIKAEVSVRELAAFAYPGGSIQTASRVRRLEKEGQQAHLRVQSERPDTYQSEVSLSYLHEEEDIELLIRGRMDGLMQSDDGHIIEEIKSSRLLPDEIEPQDRHLAQAKLYAAIYAVQQSLEGVRVQLTYVSIPDGTSRVFEYLPNREELESFFQGIVTRYVEMIRIIAKWKRERDMSIASAEFPFSRVREGQDQFMEAVSEVVEKREKLFVRAPTGIGKTAGALYPVLRRMSAGDCELVFYLSARTTAQANAEQTLDAMRKKGVKLRSVTLTAKSKICFLGLDICEPDGCPFAEGYYDRLPEALDEIRGDSGGGYARNAVETIAHKYTLCPHELSLDISLFADVVICDYNYVFDPMVYLRRFFQNGSSDGYVLLIDEAHNLVDRSADMFTGVIRKKAILACKKLVEADEHPGLAAAIKAANTYLIALRKTMKEERLSFWLADNIDEELEEKVGEILEHFPDYFSKLRGDPIPGEMSDLYRSVLQFTVIAGLKTDGHRVFAELNGSDVVVKLLCIDPSELLRNRTDGCRSTIFFSATLTPFEYFTSLLDGGEDVRTLSLESPFPKENLGVYIDSRVSTRYRDRERSLEHLTEYARTFAGKGNCIFFFPSYAYLEMTLAKLTQESSELEILVQQRGMDDLGRRDFLESFVAEHPEGVLAFAVLGGIFGEGIDLVGERLVAAVIVGVGLPPISDERNLMKEYYEARFSKGFHFAYTYPGMNRVLQAAGRVIRSPEDRGTVLFIGQRFGTEGYKRLLTPEYAHAEKVDSPEMFRLRIDAAVKEE